MFRLQRAAERVAGKLPESLLKICVLAREHVTCCECSVLVSLFTENVTWLGTVACRDWVGRLVACCEGSNEVHGPQPLLKIRECTNKLTVSQYKVFTIKTLELRYVSTLYCGSSS